MILVAVGHMFSTLYCAYYKGTNYRMETSGGSRGGHLMVKCIGLYTALSTHIITFKTIFSSVGILSNELYSTRNMKSAMSAKTGLYTQN